jgi:DNA mismatch repair protein MutS2
VESARKLVSTSDMRTEDMLADIHRLRVQAAQKRDEASAARSEAERQARELRERLADIDVERQTVLDEAHRAAAAELEPLRVEVRALRRRLQAAAAPLDAVTAVDAELEELEDRIAQPDAPELGLTLPPIPPLDAGPLRPGDVVWVLPLSSEGQVLQVGNQDAEVQVGPGRTRVSLTQLELRRRAGTAALIDAAAGERAAAGKPGPFRTRETASPGLRLDLRGCLVEEALEKLDRYLDTASRAELPWVHIIHGKGTGALRRAVREALAKHPLVSSYEAGGEGEGGEGVTVVRLVQG